MGLRRWVKRLERDAEGLHHTLTLPDGTKIRYRHEEMLEAVAACVRRREHWLLPHILKMDGYQGMVGLVKRLHESRIKSGDGF
jgi:hypothetical protein